MQLEKILPANGPSINEVKKYIDKYSKDIIVIKCGGSVLLEKNSQEKLTEGLDGLGERLEEYKSLGASFTKWRAIITIDNKANMPSDYCIESNSFNLARYAKIVQDCDMVPIVEPEVIMDGEHSIEDCYEVTCKTLKNVFKQLKHFRHQFNY